MKPIIYDLSEMSDSLEVYQSKASNVIYYFIYSVLILIIIIIGWMAFSNIDITIKGQGMFRNETNSSDISVALSGIVKKCNIEEGDYVREGDELIQIEYNEVESNIASLQEKKKDLNERVEALNAYLDYLDGVEKSISSIKDNKFYYEIKERISLLELNQTDNSKTESIQSTILAKEKEIKEYDLEIGKLNNVKKSIIQRNNMFEKEQDYYYRMVESYLSEYNLAVSQYDTQITQIKNESPDIVSSLNKEKLATLENLENSYLKNINQLISTIYDEKKRTEQEKMTLEEQLKPIKNNNNDLITKLSEKQKIIAEINANNNNLDEINDSISNCELEKSKAIIRANKSGYVYLNKNISVGSYLGTGSVICRIIPEDISETYAEIYINNADIAHLEEGQKVRFNVAAYPSSEYGDIIGTVVYISKDIKKDSIQNTPVYYVKVSCENGIVQNWKGETGTLLNGMLAEANIIVGEKSVLQCFLEEVKLWFTE